MQIRTLAPTSLLSLALLALTPLSIGCGDKEDGGADGADGGDGGGDDGADGDDGDDGDDGGDGSDGTDVDADEDGYFADEDCDDTNPDIHPDADELCNSIDDDCDDEVDEDAVDAGLWYPDTDADSYGDADATPVEACAAPTGTDVQNAEDCDDTNADVSPDGVELCNTIDDDCDGEADEGATDLGQWYPDADEDSYGDASATPVEACAPPTGTEVPNGNDCDDSDADVNPAATEICNEVDDDCDLSVDEEPSDGSTWYLDADADGFGDALGTMSACSQPTGYVDDDTDCNDADELAYPSAAEICDGQYNDCDDPDYDSLGAPDDETDDDSDGYVECEYDAITWVGPSSVVGGVDCDDADAIRSPGEAEVCDDISDNDCDSSADCDDSDCASDAACAGSLPVCADDTVGTSTGTAVASGSNSGMVDDFDPSCGSSGGEDVAYAFEAPDDGCYTISTISSSYDTLLALYEDDCTTEIECDDDDGGTGNTSLIQIGLTAGEQIVAVVDAYSSTYSGTYQLNISTFAVDLDLGTATGDALATGSLPEADRDLDTDCESSDGTGTDYVYSWTAPTTGTVTIDTESSTADTVVAIYDTSSGCPQELDCDDDGGSVGSTSLLTYDVVAGTEYVIRVGNYSSNAIYSGTMVLDINY